MPVVYSQDWSAGNSTFSTTYAYDRVPDGTDPLYPEMWAATDVNVSGGRVVWGGVGNYDAAGCVFRDLSFDGTEGYIEVEYTPNSDVLANSGDGLFYVNLIRTHPLLGFPTMYWGMTPQGSQGAPFDWDIGVLDFNTDNYDATYTAAAPTFVAGTPYIFKMSWKCGTPTGSPFSSVADDGFVRFYLDGVLVYEITGYAVFIDDAQANAVGYVGLPSDVTNEGTGLFGSMGPIEMFEGPEDTSPAEITGSLVAGVNTTVTATRAIAFGLNEETSNLHDEIGKFKVFGDSSVTGYFELVETPSAPDPAANKARIWAEDNGSGKTRIMVQFGSGSPIQMFIEA